MKVKMHICKEIEVEIKDDNALIELDNFYRSHPCEEWNKVNEKSINEAVKAVESETGLSVFTEFPELNQEVVCGVYAMDGNAILEW